MAVSRPVIHGEQERAEALLAMGFNATEALLLAATHEAGERVDLERLRWMLASGCDHSVALRILL